jgi:uncharacterized protein Yka (UPF0111/DUF47 family)
MKYDLKDVVNMLRIYHQVESEAKFFLSLSAFASKHKEQTIKSAQRTLAAIEEYKKLPQELRSELEKDKGTNVSQITELTKLCKQTLNISLK